ncbi:MAG: hypothetical protein FWC66_08245 [Oscillospiraceae bacterium]|nr:hypothetical protein [Oscillospiraceae bacterium]
MAEIGMYDIRAKRIADAIALREPDMVPMIPKAIGAQYVLGGVGSSHKSEFYDFDKAIAASINYHREFQPDIRCLPDLVSGRANEIAQSAMIDWPGRPGTKVPDTSSYQFIEQEFMAQEEYDELLSDFTGFMFKKYIPRAYSGLKGLEGMNLLIANILGTKVFTPMVYPGMKDALSNLIGIIEETEKAIEHIAYCNRELKKLGFPPYNTSAGEVPFDIISDFFRGTMGMFEDFLEMPEKVLATCEMLANKQMQDWKPYLASDMPIKRVFFPLHKGMDGFMSPVQYDELYWSPFQSILKHLIAHGVTPIIYCEGPYETRIDYIKERLLEFPAGSCIIHFEEGDFAEIKRKFEGLACISGGMSLYLLEWGTKENVVDRVKYLVDNCAAGGGFLLNSSGSIENVKRENYEAMFETARTYGKSR